jgi:hypothetical protein
MNPQQLLQKFKYIRLLSKLKSRACASACARPFPISFDKN